MSSMEALRPTKQIVSVLRKHGRMNRRVLWEHLVAEQTSSYPHPDFAPISLIQFSATPSRSAKMAAPSMPFFIDTKSRSIAAIKSKLHAKDLLRWLVQKNQIGRAHV